MKIRVNSRQIFRRYRENQHYVFCTKINIGLDMKYLVLYFLCFGFFTSQGKAQVSMVAPTHARMTMTPVDYHSMFSRQFDFNIPVKQTLLCQSAGMNKYPTLNHLPGMFCKLEYNIEKKSKLAPRFRLGSLAYTEWMEGKRTIY